MRLVTSYEKQSFLASWPSTQRLGLLVVCAALNCTAYADPPAARAAAAASAAPSPQKIVLTPASEAIAAKVQQDDRMAILESELTDIKERLARLMGNGDQAAITRTAGDLDAIEREIARVQREPVHQVKNTKPPASAPDKTESVAQAANLESQPTAGEKITYESWDIFKNFGHKGN